MGGRSSLFPGSSIGLDSRFEFLTRTERHDAASGDGNLFAGLRIAPRSFVFVTQIEVSETGKLDLFPNRQGGPQIFEKGVYELASFTLVQAELVEQRLGHVRFR